MGRFVSGALIIDDESFGLLLLAKLYSLCPIHLPIYMRRLRINAIYAAKSSIYKFIGLIAYEN